MILFRARSLLCALPIGLVQEVMRPLPAEPLAAAPGFVVGVSLIRGAAVPVVDAGALIGAREAPAFTRYLTLRAGEGSVALAVEAISGIRDLPPASMRRLPPLLRDAGAEMLSTLGALDAELLRVLKLARTVTDRILAALEANGKPA
ncbi:MAG: chemotaxis protein CheW [Sphingomonas sp.]